MTQIDIRNDGKILKKILTEGTGETPKRGSTVSVHYVGTLTDGTKFDSSRDRKKEFQFVLGAGRVIAGWDIGVATMKVGEKSVFTLHPDVAYGRSGVPGVIPPQATLVFEVELKSFN